MRFASAKQATASVLCCRARMSAYAWIALMTVPAWTPPTASASLNRFTKVRTNLRARGAAAASACLSCASTSKRTRAVSSCWTANAGLTFESNCPMRIKLLLPTLLLAACASTPQGSPSAAPPSATPYQPPVVVVSPHHVVDELLSYHQQLLRLPRAELSRDLDRLIEKPKDLKTSIQKAMVLGQMGRKTDLARAQSNLADVLNHPAAEAQQFKPLAQLL